MFTFFIFLCLPQHKHYFDSLRKNIYIRRLEGWWSIKSSSSKFDSCMFIFSYIIFMIFECDVNYKYVK